MRAVLTRRWVWWLAIASSGGAFVLTGCDPNVREQVLTGVGDSATGLATTFIGAFFQALINDAQEQDQGTVVRATFEQDAPVFT
jgi:hypothetical protein